MNNMRAKRERMVEQQLVRRGLHDRRVLDAMRAVPRELFVPPRLRSSAYTDGPLPIACGQTISQPYVVALMAASVEPPLNRILEVGTGSGYAAAVLGHLAGKVYTIERHRELADSAKKRLADLGLDNVFVTHGDGTKGWPEHAPYEGIVVTAGAIEIPEALRQQLAVGGMMVIPVGDGSFGQTLRLIRRMDEDRFTEKSLGGVSFVPLVRD